MMTKIKLTVLLLFVSTSYLYAIPAIPHSATITQPDGSTLTVMIKGDERINWYMSMDGYTLLYNKAGFLSYAAIDEDGNIQPSDFIATDIEKREVAVSAFLRTIDKNLFYSDLQKQIMLKVWEIEDEAYLKDGKTIIGEIKTLCAFVQFSNKSFIKPISAFEAMMNQLGYTGNGTGSVRDFFKEVSYNQLNLTITLCGIYTAPQIESYYAGYNGSENCRELARWAIEQVAAEPGMNFEAYDGNNDGTVDGFHFIFAGMGQEAGGGSESIWSHKWQFSPAFIKDGKSVSIYSCSPELISGSTITTIGVICHEMTHALGNIPDFYDTNGGTGGNFEGTGNWDLMANGSWNGAPGGNCPAHPNMYVKQQLGWTIPVVLNSRKTITNMPNSAENPVAYRINTATNNEYYLLENRQRIKFDSGIPGDGLLIYHVSSFVNNDCVNCSHPQHMYPVCASRTSQVPTSAPGSYGNINSNGTPFPGSSANTSFENTSTPAMISWANVEVNKPITNITHANRFINFEFMDGNSYTINATCGENGSITPSGEIEIFEGESQTYTITPDTHYSIETVLINGENNPEAVSTGTYTFTKVYSNQIIHATFAKKIYKVTFNAYGGSGNMEPQSLTYGTEQNLTPNKFTKEGFKFANWNTQANGGGISYEDEQPISLTSNLTLIAQWVKDVGNSELTFPNIEISIHPNPFTNEIYISEPELVQRIQITNIFGQIIKEIDIFGNSISTNELPKGIYFIVVEALSGTRFVHKMIKM